jgi:hypothetical protein
MIYLSVEKNIGCLPATEIVSEMDPGSTVRESEMAFHQSDACESPRVRKQREPTGGARLWVPASTGASADGCETLRRRERAPTGEARLRVPGGASARERSATAIAPSRVERHHGSERQRGSTAPPTGRSATQRAPVGGSEPQPPTGRSDQLTHTSPPPPSHFSTDKVTPPRVSYLVINGPH